MSRNLLKGTITLFRKDESEKQFHIQKHIGSGASCLVYRAVCDDNTEHLIKEYYPRDLNLERKADGSLDIPDAKKKQFKEEKERFEKSVELQTNIRLSEGLKNYTSNVQEILYGNNTVYVDMTVIAGCTYEKVKEETLHTLMQRMRTLTKVIGCYHDAGLLHLDIKPENIFVRPEGETVEDILLFDYDSVIEKENIKTVQTLFYTKDWAAQEQILPYKRENICEATDFFSIGEIIFTKIFGRHSTQAERRSFADYDIDCNAEIFKNVNPKVFPLLKDFFRHTICAVVSRRYQAAKDMIAALDEIIKLSEPKEPCLISSQVKPVDFFIGRDDELATIHKRLEEKDILFLSGIGGIGKSELARNYAKIHKDNGDYDTILFATYGGSLMTMINNDSNIHITNFERLSAEEEESYYCRKIGKLQELVNERTLFVIDNLNEDEFDSKAKKQWTDILNLGCKLLVTTRQKEWGYGVLEIGVLSKRDNLVALFEKYCTIKDDNDRAAVHEIIDYVNGHTLTVELIAKQAGAGFSTPIEMFDKLKEGMAEIGTDEIYFTKDNEQHRATAFDHITALFNIANLDKQEKYVLANMSLIPLTGIKAEWFGEWCELEDFNAVNTLINGGWLIRVDDVIKMHPVINEVARTIFDKGNYECIMPLLSNSLMDTDNVSKVGWQSLKELFVGISNNIIRLELKSEGIIDFLSTIAYSCSLLGNGKEAVRIAEYVLSFQDKILDANDINCAITHDVLTREYWTLGAFEKVLEHSKKIIDISDDKLFLSNAYSYLSRVYHFQSNDDEEEAALLKCIDLNDSGLRLHLYKALVRLYERRGDSEKAEEYRRKVDNEEVDTLYTENLAPEYFLYEWFNGSSQIDSDDTQVVQLVEALVDSQSSILAEAYSQLGGQKRKQDNLSGAKADLQKANEIMINATGEVSLSTAQTYFDLGELFYEQELIPDAEEQFLLAASIFEKLGYDKTEIACNTYYYLYNLYFEKNQIEKAEEYGLKVLSAKESMNIDSKTEKAFFYQKLGNWYYEQKDYKTAEEHFLCSLEAHMALENIDETNMSIIYHYLGIVCHMQNKSECAKKHFLNALSHYKAVYGKKHQEVVNCHWNIGIVCEEQGQFKEAKKHIFKALEISLDIYGEVHRMTAICYKALGRIYEQLGDSSKASEYMKKGENISNLLPEKDAAT